MLPWKLHFFFFLPAFFLPPFFPLDFELLLTFADLEGEALRLLALLADLPPFLFPESSALGGGLRRKSTLVPWHFACVQKKKEDRE